mmetsp:Transcript_20148/g.27213  ORF Transcript_20148/g.27213 Transcript_20148/m.27213 type:complete len:89 (+) Transcript_20148:2234-2500(+)|eukprot:CAMPEP_0185575054 /NCGR_PEP_ID=MMETSP0434-20130131/6352_1 /TAXON_ID=626734 ORGANISM="Favella taraikaensis, Strain Fe Narragansett Bay" /NCGR_SAMPLE_ID=MMETSP0434 /ASSEMBLY_ACC=CAM_ASM_000379 /LENGTH=88 /DNA_ID=CAMNT_0028191819 /DNA_START=2501 /DNA_END=2767 /DNA_ORIENTATION=+
MADRELEVLGPKQDMQVDSDSDKTDSNSESASDILSMSETGEDILSNQSKFSSKNFGIAAYEPTTPARRVPMNHNARLLNLHSNPNDA